MHLKFRVGTITFSTHVLVMLVFSVFFIMKMIRAFAQTTVEGGIWNYIQILFSLIGLVLLVLYFNKLMKSLPVLMMFIYSAVSMFASLVSVQSTRSALFDYFMIPFALFILVIACCDAANNPIDNNMLLLVCYYVIAGMFIINFLAAGSYDTSVGATADVYYVLGLMPVAMIQTRRFRFVPMLVCGAAVLLSGKRTGIVAYFIIVIVYYLYQAIMNRRYFRVFYYLIGMAIVIFIFVMTFSVINDSFNDRLLIRFERVWESGDTSGRTRFWEAITNELGAASIWQRIVGHGNLATVNFLKGHAHNDFLEVFYDYGIIPLLAYIGFYAACVIEAVKMIRSKYENTVFFIMSIMISFSLAMFSFYIIDPTYITSGMIATGFFLTDYQLKHQPNHSLAKL